MPFAVLDDRTLISVTGPDAEHFLQNILTVDLDALDEGEAKPGALLSPQGKILFDFLISRSGPDALRLECRAAVADDFVRRLTLYKLRAKVEIAKQDRAPVAVAWQIDRALPTDVAADTGVNVIDTRFGGAVRRRYGGQEAANGNPAAWKAYRIAHGVAESGDDYSLGEAFPHDVLLDQNGGVGFAKGCYVGQEVVSRMQHRGTARRRVLLVAAESALPAPGTDLTAEAKPVGTLGSVSGGAGLAIVRMDRVKAAVDAGVPILATGLPVTLSIPGWAAFTFPRDAAQEDG